MPKPSEIRVLLVDDQASVRDLARYTLARIGIGRIEEAADGTEALAKLASATFDLVLSDWIMARMDGLALLGAIRAEPRTARVPVILMTGKAHAAGVAAATGSGASDVVVKPFDGDAVRASIERALGPLE